jgi:hypothetical protein
MLTYADVYRRAALLALDKEKGAAQAIDFTSSSYPPGGGGGERIEVHLKGGEGGHALEQGWQKTLRGDAVSAVEEYKLRGFWTTKSFMPSCFVRTLGGAGGGAGAAAADRAREAETGASGVGGGATVPSSGSSGGGFEDTTRFSRETLTNAEMQRVAGGGCLAGEAVHAVLHTAEAERGCEEGKAGGEEREPFVEFKGLYACGRRYKKDILFVVDFVKSLGMSMCV